MPMGRQEQSLYSENRIRALGFLFAFGGSIHMKLPSNLVSLPDIHTYLRTSRDAFGKRISVAQARFQRQRGHANGPRIPIALFREYKQSYQHFLCFSRRRAHLDRSNLMSLPGIHKYLRTSRKALSKRISIAQTRCQSQNKHANGATVTV